MENGRDSEDERYMARAVHQARRTMREAAGGPVGAVVVRDGEVFGAGGNSVAAACDPTAHAEINAIRTAAQRINDFRLDGCTLYATAEPCPMCLAAILWCGIERVVYSVTHDQMASAGFDDTVIFDDVRRQTGRR